MKLDDREEQPVPQTLSAISHPSRLRVVGALFAVALAIAVLVLSRLHFSQSTGASFSFEGRSIEEFHCSPGNGRHPAVILLHGAGYRGTNHDDFQKICAALADWLPEDEIPLRAASLLATWADSGIIVAIN